MHQNSQLSWVEKRSEKTMNEPTQLITLPNDKAYVVQVKIYTYKMTSNIAEARVLTEMPGKN